MTRPMPITHQSPALCPSAQPDTEGSVAFGVVGGTADEPRVSWIEQPVPVTPELLAMTGDASPTQVFRFAGACQESSCQHFDGAKCQLATRLVAALAPVADKPPPCLIRPGCRWYRQEGVAACQRCPQIATEYTDPSPELAEAARPQGV